MTTINANYYSFKFKDEVEINSHKTFRAAIRKAGDFGYVYGRKRNKSYVVLKQCDGGLCCFNSGHYFYIEPKINITEELINLNLIGFDA